VKDLDLALYQQAVFVLNPHCLLSIRHPDFSQADDGFDGKAMSSDIVKSIVRKSVLDLSANTESPTPFNHEKTPYMEAMQGLLFQVQLIEEKQQISSNCAHLFDPSIDQLLMSLVDVCVDACNRVRDQLVDWEDILRISIARENKAAQSIHMRTLRRIWGEFKSCLSPLTKSLGGGDASVTPPQWKKVLPTHASRVEIEMQSACYELERIAKFSVDRTDAILKLEEQYKTNREDSMNNIMYVLTLVTVYTVPMGFFTGMFGMNFTDMAELDGENNIGYALFWICLVTSTILISVLMSAFGVWKA
jgi:hypothetical protein